MGKGNPLMRWYTKSLPVEGGTSDVTQNKTLFATQISSPFWTSSFWLAVRTN